MFPPCFDIEEMSSDVNDIASAVDESGSAVIFKSGIPVYRLVPYKCSAAITAASIDTSTQKIVYGVVRDWMQHHDEAPEEIGINNLLLRLALNGVTLDCYTEELQELDAVLSIPAPVYDEIVVWILGHIKK